MSWDHLDLPREARATFAALRDVLIPASEGMPSASEADPRGEWANRVLAARPDLKEELERTVERMSPAGIEAQIERLRQEEAQRFATLALVVTASYLINPRIHELLGYPGQISRPPTPDQADAYLDGGSLLEPVMKWQPRYGVQGSQ